MCGIFGYTGKRNALQLSIEGLKRLEYRGYDSAGIASLQDNHLIVTKQEGRVEALEEAIESLNTEAHVALAHTRWATHGPPTQRNAHPHLDNKQHLALVHNGIIENHQTLRPALLKAGVEFLSDTDTEVVCHLIAMHYHGNILKTLQTVLQLLQGSFAFALLHCDYPDQIIACTHHAPLIIGIGEGETFLASDAHAFASYTRQAVYISDGEIAVLQPDKIELFDRALQPVSYTPVLLNYEHVAASKGVYEHFTRKEIDDQPQALRQALYGRCNQEYGTADFEELMLNDNDLLAVQRILIVACGTSWNAGYLSAYLLEDLARLPTQVEIASEFRYKNPVVPPGTLVIAISQSGETADTIAAVKELKAKGVPVIALCNVAGSSLMRLADSTLLLRAGPEIGVCSTKAFTSQVTVLTLLALKMARMRNMSKADGQNFLQELERLPAVAEGVLTLAPILEKLAVKYADYSNFFFLGRRYMYPTSLEGALKLKEISYINANAYPAGEMKHGPIALISPSCPTLAFCNNSQTFDKMLSNLMEIKARRGPILAFAQSGCEDLESIVDDVVYLPSTIDELATIPASIAAQLFAYYVAKERGADIDHPRNLAKSVTVE
jgi:glucosamine--fructose-6-phosphate aminotransferase (isomerizing)